MRVAELGELSLSHRWTEPGEQGERLFSTLMAAVLALLALFAVARFTHGADDIAVNVSDPLVRFGFGAVAAVAIFTYWFCGPTSYAIYVGELGIIHRARRAFSTTTTGLMFHTAARVDVQLERVISDAEYSIYSHTNITFTWFDAGGAPLFVHTASVIELDQQGDWTVRASLDPAALDHLPPDHPAVFGYAAVAAFDAFQQRACGPYR